MNAIVSTYKSEFKGNSVSVKMFGTVVPWFNGIEVAVALGYKSPRNTIKKKVKPNEKRYTSELRIQNGHAGQHRTVTYINEPGLYRLVFSSKLPHAEKFKTWVFNEVLPNLRKANQLDRNILFNETDLHYNVVKFIRLHYSGTIIVPGLGEYQGTKSRRFDAWSKGYSGGQPDIIIPLAVKEYNGLAIELKNPSGKGVLSANQRRYLSYMAEQGYLVLVSANYRNL